MSGDAGMGFKEMVKADNAVFLNIAEFADLHVVKYDGEYYENIPVVIENLKESDRTILRSDHMQGVFVVSAKAYIAQSDLNGAMPEKGKTLEIDDGEALGKPYFRKYRIETSSVEMGMICLELEAIDE